MSHDYPLAEIKQAGELNQLQDNDVVERTELTQIVHQPTRGANRHYASVSNDANYEQPPKKDTAIELYQRVRFQPAAIQYSARRLVPG